MLYALHFATNVVRELYLALSLGDHLSIDVSAYSGLHDDIFAIPGRGSFINNNPGASVVGAVPYALARPVIDRVVDGVRWARSQTPDARPRDYRAIHDRDREFYRQAWERGLDVKLALAAGVTQSFAMAPLSALSVVVMFWVLGALTASPGAAAALAALYGLATPVFYRTAQLNQNLLVGHCAFFAVVLLWRPWADARGGRPGPRHAVAGLLAGWAVVTDYTGLVVAAFVAAYAVARWRATPPAVRTHRDLGWFTVGVIASGAALLVYQWAAFGHPLHPAQLHMPPSALSQLGLSGITWPRADLLWETAFGPRFGLFISAPVLLLALYPPAWLSARIRLAPARETAFMVAFCATLFLACGAIQYGRFQVITGVRYIVPVAPWLFLIAAGVLMRMRGPVAVAVAVVTAYASWCLAMFREVESGRGILESIVRITTEGPRLPWLTTLERMGYVAGNPAPVVLGAFALFLVVLWRRSTAA